MHTRLAQSLSDYARQDDSTVGSNSLSCKHVSETVLVGSHPLINVCAMFQGRELPLVLINGAVSADGKLALENRSLIQFSSRRDQFLVFQLRARADAVLSGVETVEAFHLELTAGPPRCRAERKRKGLPPEPLRILVSEDGRVSARARI